VAAKDAEIAVLREELAVRDRQIAGHELRLAELERRLGMNSANSGTPPSKESIAAKARRKAQVRVSQRERSADRKPGGQKGHRGVGLEPVTDPDRTERADPPAECSGCGSGLAGADLVGWSWGQVWDVLPIVLEKVAWELPRLRCGCCGKVTAADPPFGRAGTVMYGPNINAAAVLLGSEGNVPVERAAMLIEALLGVGVSAGFVARAHARLARSLERAGFDEAMKAALRAENVLCGDETPVNVARKDIDPETGQSVPGSEHVVTIRTPDERLIWYRPTPSRSSQAIKALGVLEDWHGYLVRDDYAGWHQFDATLAGVGQCGAHLIRHLQGVLDLHPQWQAWAGQVQQILREANTAVQNAKAAGHTHLDPDLLDSLRARYDDRVAWGITTNRHRDWDDGRNHPGYVLASRLKDKADQVWTWATNFAVPWTNNASEQALKGPKRHQAVSGYWHTLATVQAYCRVRSYLVTTKGHGIRAIDAIHTALAGRPWLPTPLGA
jgi:hypothetical protein